MKFLKITITALIGAVTGALFMYLLDPVRGRSRRARISDQTKARARDVIDDVEDRARYEAGRVKGAVHEFGPATDLPADDAELLQKVRSEAIGPSGISTNDVEIHVDDGEVVVRGNLDERVWSDLSDRIRNVTGVDRLRVEPMG